MTAKNKRSTGRTTPKGTKNPEKRSKRDRGDTPVTADLRPELAGKVGKQQAQVARPISHNRGNR